MWLSKLKKKKIQYTLLGIIFTIAIAADEVHLVFNKFYRSEKHRNQNIPGSGLGLSIVKYITQMHNGSIKMISGKGSGTIVLIKIRNSK